MELQTTKKLLQKAEEKIVATKMKVREWDNKKNPFADNQGNYTNASITSAINSLMQLNKELKMHTQIKEVLEKRINQLKNK